MPTPPDANVKLLIGADTSVSDESASARALTLHGNAARTTAQAKFGAGSVTFDGAGDSVRAVASPDFSFGSGDFTVEAWCRFAVGGSTQALFGSWSSTTTNASWYFYLVSGTLTFTGAVGGSTQDVVTTSFSATANTWYHLAADRSGTTLRVYINGAVAGSSSSYSYTLNPAVEALTIGVIGVGNAFPAFDFNGQMDEIRIVKGLAVYAGAFTVPAAAFPRPGVAASGERFYLS